MLNINHTRTLHVNFDGEFNDDDYLQSEWISETIDHLEQLSQALQVTLKSKNPKGFIKACDDAQASIQMLNDGGLKRVVAKLKAHFKNEIKLDDFSFRRNTMRLQAIGNMLIQALIGRGMAA